MTVVGRTLADIRARLDDLSVAVGPYRVVSGKTGDGPVPVDGLQFPDRGTAAEAATVGAAYRRALRRYDPRVAVHDLIVTHARPGDDAPDRDRSLPEYCHTVAGALLEALSDGHGPVERRVMDTYLVAAERTGDRERLCLTMLESTAAALDAQLSPTDQATVVRAATRRLPSPTVATSTLEAALTALCRTGILREFTVEPSAETAGRRARRVSLVGYRPSLGDGRCPTLPVVVELCRYTGATPHLGELTRAEGGWELVVASAGDVPGEGLSVMSAGD